MDCAKVRLELVPYLYGEEIMSQTELERHLQECEECSLHLEEMATVTSILDQANQNTLPQIKGKRWLWAMACPPIWCRPLTQSFEKCSGTSAIVFPMLCSKKAPSTKPPRASPCMCANAPRTDAFWEFWPMMNAMPDIHIR